jgi:ribonuclease HI
LRSRVGGLNYLKDSLFLKFKVGMVHGSNNYVELMSLELVLVLAVEKGVTKLQIFGDSLLVIKWTKKEYETRNFLLQDLLDKIKGITSHFDQLTFHHIFRVRNRVMDGLSKEGPQLAQGV